MTAAEDVDVSPAVAAIAKRHNRADRVATGLLALSAVSAFLLTWVTLSPLPGVAVAVVLAGLLRLPSLRAEGTAELRTDDAPEAVRSAFESARPPVLALTWGRAPEVERTATGAIYTLPFLFGLRSVTMRTEVRDRPDADGFEFLVIVDDEPHVRYTVTAEGEGNETRVDLSWTSCRGFGFRRVPQWFVVSRYRDAALAAVGYEVVEWNGSRRLRSVSRESTANGGQRPGD
ncbi:hypothetical protein GCM10028857_18400 [Salinarchaeum chitinilyticum]